MPGTPEAFCSVHSRVMVRRTSFFLEAAITWRDPREGAATGARKDAMPVCTREESAAGAMGMERAIFSLTIRRSNDVGALWNAAMTSRASVRVFRETHLHTCWTKQPRRHLSSVSRKATRPRRLGTAARDGSTRTSSCARPSGRVGSIEATLSPLARRSSASMAVERDGAESAGGGDAPANTFKVYTRTGDAGTSCLFNMERRDKDDAVFEALGDVDELGVAVGIANVFALECDDPACAPDLALLSERLVEIQSRLLDVGSARRHPLDASSDWKKTRVAFDDDHVDRLEAWIDEYDVRLPPLKNFILPGGGRVSVHLHQARTTARRAERRVVPMVRGGDVAPVIGRYLNRLSDFLYTAARYAAAVSGHAETSYRKA